MNTLLNIAKSPHTSVPGVIILICSLAEIWFPQYTDQLHKTREFAMSYGLLLAGQVATKAAADETAHWKKQGTPPAPPAPTTTTTTNPT